MFNATNLKFKLLEVATLSVLTASQVEDPNAQNVRELDNYDLPALMEDLKERGLQEEIWVYSYGGKITIGDKDWEILAPVKGFRRREAWGELLKLFPDGYKYTDNDGKPQVRRFDKIRVRAYGNLDPQTRINLMLDHGQRKGLNKVELQTAFERGFSVQYTEKQIVVMLKGLLQENYPPTRKVEETPEKLLGYYRGVVQNAKRIYELPEIAHAACIKKLKGEQTWPTVEEIRDMHKIYSEEEKTDSMISKSNPGPKFMEFWYKLLGTKAEAAANGGTTRGKSASQMNRGQIEDARKSVRSPIFRRLFDIVLRANSVGIDKLPVLDKIQVELEKSLSPEMLQIIADMGKSEQDKVVETTAANSADSAPSPTDEKDSGEEDAEKESTESEIPA